MAIRPNFSIKWQFGQVSVGLSSGDGIYNMQAYILGTVCDVASRVVPTVHVLRTSRVVPTVHVLRTSRVVPTVHVLRTSRVVPTVHVLPTFTGLDGLFLLLLSYDSSASIYFP